MKFFSDMARKASVLFVRTYYFLNWYGHLLFITTSTILGQTPFHRDKFMQSLYQSSVRFLLPILILSVVFSAFVTDIVCVLLHRYQLQQEIMRWIVFAMLYIVIPGLISTTLAFHSGLNVIHLHVNKEDSLVDNTLAEKILPRLIALLFSAATLYLYILFAALITTFLTYSVHEGVSINESIFVLAYQLQGIDVIISLTITIVLAGIVCSIVGFYHYLLALDKISLRTAVSNTITRSILWILITGVVILSMY